MNDLTQARKLIQECQDTQNTYLDLGNCGITDLTELPELFDCKHLEGLDLRSNEISDIIFLEKLQGLQYLDLRNNNIQKIPLSILKLDVEINTDKYGGRGLALYGNPIESPPLEIVKQGKQFVADWFEATKKNLTK